MGEETVDRDQAVLDRALGQLGQKLGVKADEEDKMGNMRKTAESAQFAGVGSAVDAGDYGTQADAVAAQNQETREPGAAAQTGMQGSQVQTAKTQTDGSYSLQGTPTIAHLTPEQAKQTLAILDRATASLVKRAADPGAAAGAGTGGMPGSGGPAASPADGEEVGGAPNPNAVPFDQGNGGLPAAPGAPAGGTDAIIQEKIVDLNDEIQSKQEVVKTLQDIAAQAGVPTLGAKGKDSDDPKRRSSTDAETSATPPPRPGQNPWGSARSSGSASAARSTKTSGLYRRGQQSGTITVNEQSAGDRYDPGNTNTKTTPSGFAISSLTDEAVFVGRPLKSAPPKSDPVDGQTSGQGRGIPNRSNVGRSSGASSAPRSTKTSGLYRRGQQSGTINVNEHSAGDRYDPGNTNTKITPSGFVISPSTGEAVFVGRPVKPDPVLGQTSGQGRGIPNRSNVGRSSGASSAPRSSGPASARSSAGGRGRGSSSSARSSVKTSRHYRQGADASMTTPQDFRVAPASGVAQVDINDMTLAQDPDRALATQAKGASDGTPKSRNLQEFGRAADTDYKLASQRYRRAIQVQAVRLRKQGVSEREAARILDETVINQQWNTVEAVRQNYVSASSTYLADLQKLVRAGHSYPAARASLRRARGQSVEAVRNQYKTAIRKFQGMLRQAEQELSPADVDIPGGTHPEYTGNEAGDRGADLITPGNVETLVSPETKAIEQGADSYLDQRHDDDVAGSVTTARVFSTTDKKKILSVLKDMDDTSDHLHGIVASWTKHAMFGKTPGALDGLLAKRASSIKAIGDSVEKLLKLSQERRASRQKIREAMSKALKVAMQQVTDAGEIVKVASILDVEVKAREAKLARVNPAFKLALNMHANGHIDVMELPEKVASFVGMSDNEFKKVAEFAQGLQPAGRNVAGGMGKTAARLPFVRGTSGDGLDDVLAGIFE